LAVVKFTIWFFECVTYGHLPLWPAQQSTEKVEKFQYTAYLFSVQKKYHSNGEKTHFNLFNLYALLDQCQ
jgi:hypothetical protein